MNLEIISFLQMLVAFTSSLVIIGVSLVTVIGFLGRLWWTFDLFSHFRVQYFVLLTGFSLLALFIGIIQVSIIGLIFALVNLITIIPVYFPQHKPNGKTKILRILLANVLRPNQQYGKLQQFIQKTRPHMIVLLEISEVWLRELSPVLKDYPYKYTAMRNDNYGIAIFSHYELDSSQTLYLSSAMVPTLVGDISTNAHTLTLIATHPPPPKSKIENIQRNQQIKNLVELINLQENPTMLLGDMNITSWSPFFKELIKFSRLIDTRKGFGLQPTWPADKPIFMVPIDHILVSEEISIHKRFTGPYIGSDHRPVVVDFSFNKQCDS